MKTRQMRIVLVDDDEDDRDLFNRALKVLPVPTRLTTLHDGEQLMKYLSENLEHLPHVLFLDIHMPKKNGFECLTEIKNNEKMKDLPVVMFSTDNSRDKIEILFRNGAGIYIRKPESFTELIQVIHHALPLVFENIFSNGKLKYILNA